jgi:hypothetical protein
MTFEFGCLFVIKTFLRFHADGFTRAFLGADTASLAIFKIGFERFILADHALGWAKQSAQSTINTLLDDHYGPFGSPASGVQIKKQLICVGPRALAFKIDVFTCHRSPPLLFDASMFPPLCKTVVVQYAE